MTRFPFRNSTLVVALVGVACAASSSGAADGVIEINQTRALAGGVSPSDTPGFPVTIDAPGSYALASNLTVSGLTIGGVLVTAADVTIDLRGFTIQGGCPPAGCALGTGTAIGIEALESGIHIHDGRVRGFSSDGIAIGARSRVADLWVEGCGRVGIFGSSQVDVVDTTVIDNSDSGIGLGHQAKVRRCVADSNGFFGIVVGNHSSVSDSRADANSQSSLFTGATGIRTGTAPIVRGNVVRANAVYGIDAGGAGGLVIENIAEANGHSGFSMSGAGAVQRNTSNNNGHFGMSFATTGTNRPGYRENVANGSPDGAISGGTNVGGNSCNGTATCP